MASVLTAYTPTQGAFGGTIPLTVASGSNKLLIVGIQVDDDTTISPTVTFDGDAVTAVAVTTGTGNAIWVGQVAIGDVTGDLDLVISGVAENSALAVMPIMLSDVDQADPIGEVDLEELASASDATGGSGVASELSGLVLSFIAANNQSDVTPTGTDQTEIEQAEVGGAYAFGASQQPGTGSTVISAWDWSGTNRASHIFFAVNNADGGVTEGTALPTTGSVILQGLVPLVNAFSVISLRGTVINEAGSPVADATGISALVWYGDAPSGAPDESLSSLTTNANGSYSWALALGGLTFHEAVYRVIYRGDPPDTNHCGRRVPDYE